MSLPVYYVPWLWEETERIGVGSELSFSGEEARHAAAVKRTRPGERIEIVDGQGVRIELEVTQADKAAVTGIVCGVCREEPHAVRLTLIQALAKGGRDEQAIETATEYGVDALMPWQADRSVARWEGAAKISKGFARWEAIVHAAGKQSRRSYFPSILPFVNSADLVEWIEKAVASGTRVYICHESVSMKLVDVLTPNDTDIALIVGPEGGISESEVARFEQAGRAQCFSESILCEPAQPGRGRLPQFARCSMILAKVHRLCAHKLV